MNRNDIIRDLHNLEDIFDFKNLDQNHEFFSIKNKKVFGNFTSETPKNLWIDDFVCLRSKIFSPKCGDESKNKLKCFSQSQTKQNEIDKLKNVWVERNMKENVIIMF